ncbi:MAG: AMP-binding protein [Gammaproteobacteria bacterium]|nr:AMP-binding protein [Gammaproteobacteria bacterium]
MTALLTKLSDRNPNDVVIECEDGAFTAQQLLTDIEVVSATLVAKDIGRLGLLARNSAAWVTVDLACQSAAICLLPMPAFFADNQLRHSMKCAGLQAVLTDNPQRFSDIAGSEIVFKETGQCVGLTLILIEGAADPLLPPCTQKITFTSGSTGTPRGVCLGIDHQLRVASALDQALQIKAPRHLCLLPLSTLLENLGGIYYPLLADGVVSIPPETTTGFSGGAGLDTLKLIRTISRHRPASIIILPQMLVGLVAALEEGWTAPEELKFAAVGGAKVSAGLIRRARDLGLPVYEGYGLSEAGSVACLNHPGCDQIGTVGQSLAHVDVSIEAGEVVVKGNTFLGYVGEPDSWGAKSLLTGDLGELDAEGYLNLEGRRKNLLITSLGRNISPEWIESELLLYPEIEQCIVFGDARPFCAALIKPANPDISTQAMQSVLDAVNTKLPEYAQIKRWHRLQETLSVAEALYTENGRPRRAAIASRFGPVIDSLYSETMSTASL